MHRNGWIDKIVEDAGLIRRAKNNEYTYENVLKIAKGFKTVYGWRTNHLSSYSWATHNGYAAKIRQELNLLIHCFDENKFTFDECLEDAKKWNNVHNWRKNGTTYYFSEKKKWVEDIATRVGYSKGKRKKLWWFELL